MSIIILFTASAFFATGLIAGGFGGYQIATVMAKSQEVENAEAQYYRGVYDVCVQQTRQFSFCLKMAQKVNGSKWYEKPSSGWEWPLAVNSTIAKGK
jgi:hypothetical protein